MRTEHAPQRQRAPCDLAEIDADEQEGHMQDTPWSPGMQLEQVHAAPCAAPLREVRALGVVPKSEVLEAVRPPGDRKNASAARSLVETAAKAREAAPIMLDFMTFRGVGGDCACESLCCLPKSPLSARLMWHVESDGEGERVARK